MKVYATTGREDIAQVFIADMGSDRVIEFVESIEPPFPREHPVTFPNSSAITTFGSIPTASACP